MSLAVSRTVLRQSTSKLSSRAARRFESTTSKAKDTAKDAANTAKDTAASFQSKASEGLSRASAAAGPAIAGYAKGLGNALGKIGGRTGRLISFIERGIPPTLYYGRVGLELSKLVFQGQKMAPPPVSTFQGYFQSILKSLRHPRAIFQAASPETLLQRIRNASSTQLVSSAVIGAELLGFFTVGEIIGRRKLVGYHGDAGAAHH